VDDVLSAVPGTHLRVVGIIGPKGLCALMMSRSCCQGEVQATGSKSIATSAISLGATSRRGRRVCASAAWSLRRSSRLWAASGPSWAVSSGADEAPLVLLGTSSAFKPP
jgi:hypothetical protein